MRKGVGQPPGNVGEVAMGEVRLDTGTICKGSRGTRSGIEEANLLWLQPQHSGLLCKLLAKAPGRNSDVGTMSFHSERLQMIKLGGHSLHGFMWNRWTCFEPLKMNMNTEHLAFD